VQSTVATVESINESYIADMSSLDSMVTTLQSELRGMKGKCSDLAEQNETLQQSSEYLGRSYHQLEEVQDHLLPLVTSSLSLLCAIGLRGAAHQI
jgi:FtsZ-binding cell division protein ZapB